MNTKNDRRDQGNQILKIVWFIIIALCLILLGFRFFAPESISKPVSDWLFPLTVVLAILYLVGRYLQKRKSKPKPQASDSALVLSSLEKKTAATKPKAFKRQKRQLSLQTERMQEKNRQAEAAIDHNFKNSVITKTRFASALAGGINAYAANSEKILMLMTLFDEEGFEQMERLHQTSSEPYKEMLAQLDEADALLGQNEKILASVDRLQRELCSLSSYEAQKQLEPVLEDLKQAADQTSLYQSENGKGL